MSGANKSVVPPAPSGGIVGKKATMKRLKGFDYRKPYFYMVTLKRLDGLLAFSQITEEAGPAAQNSSSVLPAPSGNKQ
jgi:hypothetical protein